MAGGSRRVEPKSICSKQDDRDRSGEAAKERRQPRAAGESGAKRSEETTRPAAGRAGRAPNPAEAAQVCSGGTGRPARGCAVGVSSATSLTRAEWFLTLDLASGYWQVEMDPQDRENSARVV